MNENRLKMFFLASFFLIPILLLSLSYYLSSEVRSMEREIYTAQKELTIYGRQVRSAGERISMYKEILAAVDLGTSEVPDSGVELFSIVQTQLTANGILSRVIDEAGRSAPQGDRGVRISFEGAYPAFIMTIADWRQMDVALRVKQLSITGHGEQMVKGDILLETIFGK